MKKAFCQKATTCISLIIIHLNCQGQNLVERSIEGKLDEEIRMMTNPNVKYGPSGNGKFRALSIQGESRAKKCSIILGDHGSLKVELRIAFLNLPGSEAANVVEYKDEWVTIPNKDVESGVNIKELKEIMAILSAEQIKFNKTTFLRKNKLGKLFLVSKDLQFTINSDNIALVSRIIGPYFKGLDSNKVTFKQSSSAIP